MKKIFIAALLGLVVSLVSCVKDEDAQMSIPSGKFEVETLTEFNHKFPHWGREPLEITGEQYTYSAKTMKTTGLISTNYGDIPLKFPYFDGLKIAARKDTYLLTYDDPFFLHGGYIILDFYFEGDKFKTDSIAFDIIAPKEDINAWERGEKK